MPCLLYRQTSIASMHYHAQTSNHSHLVSMMSISRPAAFHVITMYVPIALMFYLANSHWFTPPFDHSLSKLRVFEPSFFSSFVNLHLVHVQAPTSLMFHLLPDYSSLWTPGLVILYMYVVSLHLGETQISYCHNLYHFSLYYF